jgi:hypothetical protein
MWPPTCTNKLKGAELLLNFLHGLQSGMDAESILEALVNGRPSRRRR